MVRNKLDVLGITMGDRVIVNGGFQLFYYGEESKGLTGVGISVNKSLVGTIIGKKRKADKPWLSEGTYKLIKKRRNVKLQRFKMSLTIQL